MFSSQVTQATSPRTSASLVGDDELQRWSLCEQREPRRRHGRPPAQRAPSRGGCTRRRRRGPRRRTWRRGRPPRTPRRSGGWRRARRRRRPSAASVGPRRLARPRPDRLALTAADEDGAVRTSPPPTASGSPSTTSAATGPTCSCPTPPGSTACVWQPLADALADRYHGLGARLPGPRRLDAADTGRPSLGAGSATTRRRWSMPSELERPGGVGHSMGGAALLMAELARPGTFRGLGLLRADRVPARRQPARGSPAR